MITTALKKALSYLTLPPGISLGELLHLLRTARQPPGKKTRRRIHLRVLPTRDCMVSGITRGDSMITCKNYILGGVTSDCRVNYP